jgi:hypothetical protein
MSKKSHFSAATRKLLTDPESDEPITINRDGSISRPGEPRTITTSRVLDASWRSILEQTIPPETHPNLVKAYKRFFYAGAKALLDSFVYSDVLDEGEEDIATPQDVNRVDAVMHEINAFFTEVAAGRQ